jgi:hypothetical protein
MVNLGTARKSFSCGPFSLVESLIPFIDPVLDMNLGKLREGTKWIFRIGHSGFL